MFPHFLYRSMVLAMLSLGFLSPVQAQPFVLRTSVFSAGGQQSTGGNLVLQSTVGQAGVGQMTSGELLLDSGFWPPATRAVGPLARPAATNDVVTTDEDTFVEINVLANDTDPGGGALTIIGFGPPEHGQATHTSETTFTYAPEADFYGEDRFVYLIQNEQGGQAQATVIITVNPVNDAPVFTSIPLLTASIHMEYRYLAKTADVEGDARTFTAPVLPAWLSLVEQTDSTAVLAGTPTPAEAGEHAVTLAISDGQASNEQSFVVTVAALAAPVLLTPEDGAVVDPTGGVPVAWQAVPGAATYYLELATVEDFSSLVFVAGDFADTTRTLRGLEDNNQYYWRVQAVGNTGMLSAFSMPRSFLTGMPVATEEEVGVPASFALHPNYPNPFNPTTTIAYDLAQAAEVRLVVYDLFGRVVETLVEKWQAAGRYDLPFEAHRLASGTYFYRIEAGAWSQTRTFVLLK